MAKANTVQTNFTAGELSPRMLGRTDIVRYNNGALRMENVLCLIHGGAVRRPGLQYLAAAKYHETPSRLIPYVFNIEQAYQLELSDQFMRVFTQDGAMVETAPDTPFELLTPWTQDKLGDIDFIQSADTMFLFHPDVPTQRLQRFASDDWRLVPAPWVTEPFDELGTRPAVSLAISNAAVGAGRTFTAGAAAFLASDVGRTIEAGGGLATITGYTSTTVVTATIEVAFSGTAYASGDWLLGGSPQTTCTPSAKDPVGATITLTLGSAGWRAEDVGRHVVINAGLCRITAYTSTTVVSAVVLVELAATVAAEKLSWALCRSMWGQEFGYPRTGSFHQQRLWAGGSPGFPQSTWMSRLGEYYNFEIGTTASAGYEARIASDQANPIRHLASVRALVALTAGGENTISGGNDPITPTTIDIQNQSAFGCTRVAPVRVGNELLFVCPAVDEETGEVRDEIRAMSADRFDSSSYAAPDITALAEHVTAGGIVDMDAQRNLVWAIRVDGQMVTLRLDRDNDVVAATRQITDGVFESVSAIPTGGGAKQVWAIVRRTIDGQTRRYIERFVAGLYMDSAISGTDVDGKATWTGLDHLEGKTVVVRADGSVLGDELVVDGAVTIDRPAKAVTFGLPFVPVVELMTPEFPTQAGSVQGLQMRATEVTIRVKDTIGARINGRDVLFGRFGPSVLDLPPVPYSGLERVENLGYERGRLDIVVEQPRPEPFHLLAVIRQVEANA